MLTDQIECFLNPSKYSSGEEPIENFLKGDSHSKNFKDEWMNLISFKFKAEPVSKARRPVGGRENT